MWAAGERERYEEFFRLRGLRIETRIDLEEAMEAADNDPYFQLQDNFAALIRFAEELRKPPEEEFEDSEVVVNHNIW